MPEFRFKDFGFKVPPLPKERYEFIQRVCKKYDITQWQAVIVALRLMESTGVKDRGAVEAMLEWVKEAHPKRKRGNDGTFCNG